MLYGKQKTICARNYNYKISKKKHLTFTPKEPRSGLGRDVVRKHCHSEMIRWEWGESAELGEKGILTSLLSLSLSEIMVFVSLFIAFY